MAKKLPRTTSAAPTCQLGTHSTVSASDDNPAGVDGQSQGRQRDAWRVVASYSSLLYFSFIEKRSPRFEKSNTQLHTELHYCSSLY